MSDDDREDILYTLLLRRLYNPTRDHFSDPIFVLFYLSYIYTKFRSKVFSHGKKWRIQKELRGKTPAEINMETLVLELLGIL
jgi:hypothetical protein